MLRIRLRRVGRKHDPSYQLIVAEKGRGPQTGDYVEKVGTYDARLDEYELEDERITYWLSEGAQPTDTVHNLLAKADIIDADTVNPLPKKSPIADEGEVEEDQDAEVESADETESGDEDGSEDKNQADESDSGEEGVDEQEDGDDKSDQPDTEEGEGDEEGDEDTEDEE